MQREKRATPKSPPNKSSIKGDVKRDTPQTTAGGGSKFPKHPAPESRATNAGSDPAVVEAVVFAAAT